MSDKALIPIEQREIECYEGEVIAVIVTIADKQEVYIPIRPLIERLGLNWAGQQQRIRRAPRLIRRNQTLRRCYTYAGVTLRLSL